MFDYVDERVHGIWSEEGLGIMGSHDLFWLQLYLLHVLSVFEMVWGLVNQGANDVGQLLGHSICDEPPTGNNGPEGGANFVYFEKAITFRDNCTSRIHFPVTVVTESSLVFDVPACLGKFIFEFVSRILGDGLVCIGVCQ